MSICIPADPLPPFSVETLLKGIIFFANFPYETLPWYFSESDICIFLNDFHWIEETLLLILKLPFFLFCKFKWISQIEPYIITNTYSLFFINYFWYFQHHDQIIQNVVFVFHCAAGIEFNQTSILILNLKGTKLECLLKHWDETLKFAKLDQISLNYIQTRPGVFLNIEY